jgi:hypothetical protein
MGNVSAALSLLNLYNGEKRITSFTPWQLYLRGWNYLYPLGRRLGAPQSRPGRGSEKKSFAPAKNKTMFPDHPASSVMPILTELPSLYLL